MEIKRKPLSRGGFTLVDVCVALTVVAIALATLVGSVFWAMRLEDANEETAAASQHARALLERLNEMPIGEVYAAYNSDRADDPEPGRDYLADLAIDDPLLVVGKKATPIVALRFPDDAAAELARNRLPMTLRLEWEGATGTRAVEVSTLLRDR